MRWASAPDRGDSTSISAVTGSDAAPAATGEYPSETWRNTTSRKKTPPRAAYTANVTRLAPVNCADRKMANGSIGWALRRSDATNASSAAAPTAAGTTVWAEETPAPGAWIRAKVRAPRPSVASAAPRVSSAPVTVGSRVSGMWRCAARTTKKPIGTLIRKIARQLTYWTR